MGDNVPASLAAMVTAGGALYIAGSLTTTRLVSTSESLHVGGDLALGPPGAHVDTDAYVQGNVSGALKVLGTLHVSLSSTVDPAVVAGAVVTEAVAVPPPCDCGATAQPPVSALVAAIAAANDNASIGLDPGALAAASTTPTLDLPCGRFWLSAIDTSGDLELRVHGRVLLAVGGDLVLHGGLAVTLDPGAEIDVVASGTLIALSGQALGAPAEPARVRVWLGTTGTVLFQANAKVGAILHAPTGSVSAPQGLDLWGSLLAASFAAGDAVTVHYDRAILTAGAICGVPASDAIH